MEDLNNTVKIVKDGVAYYIFESHVKNICFGRDNLLALAQITVNIKTNEFIKMRWSAEMMADTMMGVQR